MIELKNDEGNIQVKARGDVPTLAAELLGAIQAIIQQIGKSDMVVAIQICFFLRDQLAPNEILREIEGEEQDNARS